MGAAQVSLRKPAVAPLPRTSRASARRYEEIPGLNDPVTCNGSNDDDDHDVHSLTRLAEAGKSDCRATS